MSGSITGSSTLFAGGQECTIWLVMMYLGQMFRVEWTRSPDISGDLGLRLSYSDGAIAAQAGVMP